MFSDPIWTTVHATAGGEYFVNSAVGASAQGVVASDVPFFSRNEKYIKSF